MKSPLLFFGVFVIFFLWDGKASLIGLTSCFKKLSLFFIKVFEVLIFNRVLKKTLILVFLKLLFLNLVGLCPYSFSSTSHMVFKINISLILWLTFILSSFSFKIVKSTTHLVPPGSPTMLGGELFIVECLRTVIRPLTLSLRLGIKLTTGHIFLSLLGVSLISSFFLKFQVRLFIVAIFIFYFFFELFVSFIQAFVYTLLISQYIGDHC